MLHYFKYLQILLICLCMSFPIHLEASAPKLNSTNVTVLYGKTYKLKTSLRVTWRSMDESIATVKNGTIRGVGLGNTKIIATNSKGEKSTCKVTVSNYSVTRTGNKKYPNKVTVYAGGRYRTYKVYNQTGFGSSYLKQRGCSHSSAAMVMSAYGKNYTPTDIHSGSVKKKCSERYALKKLRKRPTVSGKSLSIYSISQILNNSGIKCHPVYKFSKRKAISEITSNLKRGKPVLIMTSRKRVKGVQLARSYHFLVLVGIDQNGDAIVLNSGGGVVNKSHITGKFKLSIEEIVQRHMWSCTGNKYKSFYFNGSKNYGGYIVIDE